MLKQTGELSLVDNQYSDQVFPKDYSDPFWSEELMLRGENDQTGALFSSLAYRILRLLRKNEIVKDYGSLFPRGIPSARCLFTDQLHRPASSLWSGNPGME